MNSVTSDQAYKILYILIARGIISPMQATTIVYSPTYKEVLSAYQYLLPNFEWLEDDV